VNRAIANSVSNVKRSSLDISTDEDNNAGNIHEKLHTTPTTSSKTTATPANKNLFRDLFGTSSPATAMSPDSTPSKPPTCSSILSKEIPISDNIKKYTSSCVDKVPNDETVSMLDTVSTAETESTPIPTTTTVPEAKAQNSNTQEKETTPTTLNQENKELVKVPEEAENCKTYEAEDVSDGLSLDPFELGVDLLNKRMAAYCAQNLTPDSTKQDPPIDLTQQGEEVTDSIVVNPELFVPQRRKALSPPPSERKAKLQWSEHQDSEFIVPEAKMIASPSPVREITRVPSAKQNEDQSDAVEVSEEILSISKMLSSINKLLQNTKNEILKGELNFILSTAARHLEVDISTILKSHNVTIKRPKKDVL
jgi:hypothetical protein